MRHHRAHLLIAGHHQEGRRAAIALDADREVIRFGMRQLLEAMRRHRSARMQVWIDHRAERARALEPGIEVEAKLAGHRKVGTLAGANNDAVDGAKRAARWV